MTEPDDPVKETPKKTHHKPVKTNHLGFINEINEIPQKSLILELFLMDSLSRQSLVLTRQSLVLSRQSLALSRFRHGPVTVHLMPNRFSSDMFLTSTSISRSD